MPCGAVVAVGVSDLRAMALAIELPDLSKTVTLPIC